MAAPPTEQRELQLLENVEFKILGVANNERKLHDTLQRYLSPIILKAGSEHRAVRAKAVNIIHHVRNFISPPTIVLPVAALLDQCKGSDNGLIQSLDVAFIQHSIERIDEKDRRDLIPKAISGFSKDISGNHAGPMFNVILRLLLDARIPPRGSKDDEAFRNAIGLSDEADAKCLANMLGVFLRLRTPAGATTWQEANPTLKTQELAFLYGQQETTSYTIIRRMSEMKAKIVALLASGAFTDQEKFLPALYAASSFDNKVASAAEEILKRSSVSMEDESLAKRLFQAHSNLPAAYRIRILGMLARSSISTTMSNEIMTIVNLDFLPENSQDESLAAETLERIRALERMNFQPASSLERTKLHKALFQYLSWVARVGPSREGFTIAPQLIARMRAYIETNGWPRPNQTSNDSISLRSKAYETIGVLSRGAKMSFEEKFDLAAWLFRSLSEDPTHEAVINIDGAVSSLIANIPVAMGSDAGRLKSMLLTYMTMPEEATQRSTRHAVVKWANQCLAFSDIGGRWIDLLAIAGQPDERSDVVEQGQRGLDPWTYFAHVDTNPALPNWTEMVSAYFGSMISPETIADLPSGRGWKEEASQPVLQNFQGFRIHAFPIALRYCKQIMFLTALDDFKVEPDWTQTLDAHVKTDLKTREKIQAYLRTVDNDFLVFYLQACLEGASLDDSPIIEECIRCFVDVASLSPSVLLGSLTKFTVNLLSLIKSNKKEVRLLGARALGILGAHPANGTDAVENLQKTLSALFQNAQKAVGPDLNAAEGALLGFGYLCSRCVYYGQFLPDDIQYPSNLLDEENAPRSLYEAALESFAQLWTAGLSLPSREGTYNLEDLIPKLAAQAKKGNEKAILALGRLALGLDEEESNGESDTTEDGWACGILGTILKELFALHEIKSAEVHFTVGDAITAAIARWDSDYVKLTMDVEWQGTLSRKGLREPIVVAVLGKLFADCKATKPALLKASGIWLFCIIQYCSHLDVVQSRLREGQTAFMRLLSGRDELVQETASRGLSLVYERGDSELKQALVKDLVSAFTGSGTQLKVDQETELFDPGALPTGEGSSITSYKDIVSLANEVGDQRLVYKFMSLAANAATWSTRSAFGRFGLSNILSESEVDPKLYPKLYRYRFDPNQNVQRSMDDIWKALVKDPGAVLETHFNPIIEDLLQSIFGKEWRMREASCGAISDLIHGRPFTQYERHYRDMWTAALKVLDDVKGSVREAALRLCMTLSNSLVRQLEEGSNGSAAQAMMREALPFLLSDKGIESSVKEVQGFATITVIKIAKKGGTSLKPFIPDLVSQLLGLLSSIEHQGVNYHYQRLDEDARDQIDRLRSKMVSQSPISEAIDNSLRFIDAEVMTKLAPQLEATIKSAIGMPTKIGCSRVLTTLFTRHTEDIKPMSARFLQLMEKQTMDKNDEVSQAYAGASAYIMRASPESSKQRFCERFIKLYFEAEGETRRQKVADVIVALAKISPDHFTAHETKLLPFAYLASHDTDEYTNKAFRMVWDLHAGSNRTVVRYVPEIVALTEQCLDTNQWALRHAGAFTVAAMVADVCGASEAGGQISDNNLKLIWPVFDKTLALKTFPGKEKLLGSYPPFVDKGRALWTADSKIATQMKKVAIREAKRNNDEYRVYAFQCLWKFSKVRDDLDMLDEIADIVTPHLENFKDGDKMEVDSKEDLSEKTARNGLEAVARGYNRDKMSQGSSTVLAGIFNILNPFLSDSKYGSIKREVWYECVRDLMDGSTFQPDMNGDGEAIALNYLGSIDMDLADTGTEAQRVLRAKAVASMLKARSRGVFGETSPTRFKDMVTNALGSERSLEVQKVLKEALAELK